MLDTVRGLIRRGITTKMGRGYRAEVKTAHGSELVDSCASVLIGVMAFLIADAAISCLLQDGRRLLKGARTMRKPCIRIPEEVKNRRVWIRSPSGRTVRSVTFITAWRIRRRQSWYWDICTERPRLGLAEHLRSWGVYGLAFIYRSSRKRLISAGVELEG